MVICGAGNVATHLGLAFSEKGIRIRQVISQTEMHARRLANLLDCNYTTNPAELDNSADIVLLALSDSALVPFLNQTGHLSQLIIHTSGSTSLATLEPYSSRTGVLYPLQTFTRDVPLSISEVPFFIEAASDDDLVLIRQLATALSEKVYGCSSDDRLKLHLAAVFCNNFSNHMMAVAQELLENSNLSFNHLKPLIEETARKISMIGPMKAQTGPAIRQNNELIGLHEQMLADFPDYQKIYTFVSNSIQKMYGLEKERGE
jgi:predicted short-subunit dehydrogenase-like oxidoreductase (DUF2520 family)